MIVLIVMIIILLINIRPELFSQTALPLPKLLPQLQLSLVPLNKQHPRTPRNDDVTDSDKFNFIFATDATDSDAFNALRQ